MGRGKIEIKLIENATNRQVTYSKRRSGIFKKARELAVLCDAQVSLIIVSSTGKVHSYISSSITPKQLFDKYQKETQIDLWDSHYQELQENLKKKKEINRRLRKEIRQRKGEDLDELNIDELRGLEQNVESALKIVRDRKNHVIATQTETFKKKCRSWEEANKILFRAANGLDEESHYGGGHDNDGDDHYAVSSITRLSNAVAGSHISLHLQPSQLSLKSSSSVGGGYSYYTLLE